MEKFKMVLSIMIVDGDTLSGDKQNVYYDAVYDSFTSWCNQEYSNETLKALCACWKVAGSNIEVAAVPHSSIGSVIEKAQESNVLHLSYVQVSEIGERHIRSICLGPAFTCQIDKLLPDRRILGLAVGEIELSKNFVL